MESDLIFAYGFGYTVPNCDDFIELIKSEGHKGINWSTLETKLTIEDGVDPMDMRNCLGIQQWVDPQKLKCPLSGPVVLTTSYFVVLDSIYPSTRLGAAIQFYSLRQVVWQRSQGECWLDLQIKFDVDKFIGVLSILDRNMKPRSSFM